MVFGKDRGLRLMARPENSMAAALAAALGLLLGCIWASRFQDVFGSGLFLPLPRVVAVVVFVLAGLRLKSGQSPMRGLLVVAAISFAVHVLFVAVAWSGGVSGEVLPSLGFASSCAEGVFIAAVILVVMRLATRLDPRVASVTIASGLLLATVYDLAMGGVGGPAATVQWIVGAGGALALSALGTRLSRRVETTPAVAGVTVSNRRLAQVVAAVVALMTVQGLFSQVFGLGGVGQGAFYGMSYSVFVTVVRAAVIAACLAATVAVPPPAALLASGSCVWAFSLGLIAFGGDARVSSAGALLLEMGYSALQTVPLLAAVYCARTDAARSDPILCAGAAALFSNQVSRVVAAAFVQPGQLGDMSLAFWAYVCACFVALASVAILAMGGMKAGGEVPLETARPMTATAAQMPCEPLVKRGQRFSTGLFVVCERYGLTERERDVLYETLHGRTIDGTAERLGLSRETVKTISSRAYARMGANGKADVLTLIDAVTDGIPSSDSE